MSRALRDAAGVVVIGRNEGERLRRCLRSLAGAGCPLVYVDSGSTDGSVALAASLGATVVELRSGFTAARARNLGLAALVSRAPALEFVQFVDGDCELQPGWLERAFAELSAAPGVAVVCGRRRERFPHRSVYNQLCDLEWDTPAGEAEACGGDAMARIPALREVGGFAAELIAGEEPELCLRLRRRGHRVLRVDAEMTLHDADITTAAQWWRRSMRAGHAFAEGAALHGAGPERHWVKERRSSWFWGLLPPAALALAVPTGGLSLLALAAPALLALRIYRATAQRGWSKRERRLYALGCVAAKLPQLAGQLRYLASRASRRQAGLIEYKAGAPPVREAAQ